MTTVVADNILLAAGSVEIEAAGVERKLPQITMLAYGGGIMLVPGWGDVAIDLAGLDADGQVPVLMDHDARVAAVVGHGTAQVRDGRLFVAGVVSGAGEAAQQIVELARGGFAFQASVGVQPEEHERVRPGEKVALNGRTLSSPRGFTLVKHGRLREVSITVVAADPSTSVAIAATRFRKERKMDTDVQNVNEEAIRANERERLKTIEAMCRPPVGGWGKAQQKVDELKASAIAGEIDQKDLSAELLSILRDSRPKLGVVRPSRSLSNRGGMVGVHFPSSMGAYFVRLLMPRLPTKCS